MVKNFMIAQPKRAKATGDPTKTFSCWMRIVAVTAILFFREAQSWQRIVWIAFAIIGLFLLRP